MKHKKRGRREPDQIHLGFQIAPMIDVVFVIMLFFMVMAGAVKVEHELKTTLPGNAETSTATEIPDEITIGVSENGQITINEDPVGTPQDKTLDGLFNEMTKLKQAAIQSGSKLLITVQAEEAARYERVINVLDVLARADINNVTFAVAEPE
jgi:biopolymer transport protein ExbD